MKMSHQKLFSQIKEEFDNIGITIGFTTSFAPDSDPDIIAVHVGLKGIGKSWVEIGRNDAHQILLNFLHCDLAYDTERIPYKTAEYYTSGFLGLFNEDELRIFTNGTWTTKKEDGGCNLTKVTDATYDAGVLVISSNGAGVFWIEDED